MLLAALAIAILALAGFWTLGGILLRAGGLLIAILGALELAIYTNPAGIAPLIIGIILWLAGHWHYALRHHQYKSPLAQRLFQQVLPDRLDPTRGWAWPVQPLEHHRPTRLRRR